MNFWVPQSPDQKDFWKDQVGELQSVVDYELLPENFVDWSSK